MIRDTGSPRVDAESDFLRARRQQVLTALGSRFRADSGNRRTPISLSEALTALGRRGERSLGTLVIPLDRIVGSVDKVTEFDRYFRPTSNRSRMRWERLAESLRRGRAFSPIDVYKLGDMYFVEDGHHRVSVARALDLGVIEARVKEIDTAVSPEGVWGSADLDRKRWRRILFDRVPLTGEARTSMILTDPSDYGRLAEMVEAWGARRMHEQETYLDKAEVAQRWYTDEYLPVQDLIDEGGLRVPAETAADTYLRVAGERYDITREHAWDLDVIREIARRGRRG